MRYEAIGNKALYELGRLCDCIIYLTSVNGLFKIEFLTQNALQLIHRRSYFN